MKTNEDERHNSGIGWNAMEFLQWMIYYGIKEL
jgi:hypothetical protein